MFMAGKSLKLSVLCVFSSWTFLLLYIACITTNLAHDENGFVHEVIERYAVAKKGNLIRGKAQGDRSATV
jgi:hypothetical protein